MPGFHTLRLPRPYIDLLDLSASDFAWEWIRRNADFRSLWAGVGAAARRASARAAIAARRTTSTVTFIGQQPLAERTAPWGLSFRAIA